VAEVKVGTLDDEEEVANCRASGLAAVMPAAGLAAVAGSCTEDAAFVIELGVESVERGIAGIEVEETGAVAWLGLLEGCRWVD
jgi:hypothetical protein